MSSDTVHFTTAAMAFFAIMNPIANTAIFVSLTEGLDTGARRGVATRALLVAFVVVALFAAGGSTILTLFGIDLSALRITGGALIALVGYHMLYGSGSPIHTPQDTTAAPDAARDVAISPLALPILAGPGTIATAMSLTAHGGAAELLRALAAFGVVCALTFAMFLGGERITRLLGEQVIGVVTRLMGLILAAIGVAMLSDGIRGAATAAG